MVMSPVFYLVAIIRVSKEPEEGSLLGEGEGSGGGASLCEYSTSWSSKERK